MPDGKLDHGIILAVKNLISKRIQACLVFWDRVKVIVEEFFDHDDRSIRDLSRPVINMIQQGLYDVLRANDPSQIMMRLSKKSSQPFLTTYRLCKIELMKNRKFFFLVKD